MDKQKKEVSMDFDLYVKEKQEAFKKGITDGYGFAMKAVTVYLNKKTHIKDFLTGDYTPDWEPLLKALGREIEWQEFMVHQEQEQEKQEEEKCQQPQQ